MFYPNYFILFEALAFVAFILIIIREAHQRHFYRLFEVISCAIFGIILEIGSTYLAHTYSYSDNFLVNLAQVPVAIGLGWSMIIYCAMLLSDQYNIPWTLRPFLDALTALILDLAMDTVAIRLGFWTWVIPLDKEWYGVPFENLVGWILVVLAFSFVIRFIRTLNPRRFLTKLMMIFSPLLAYLGLLLGLTAFSLLVIAPYQINNWTQLLQFNYKPDIMIMFNPQVALWKSIIFVALLIEIINLVIWSIIKYRRRLSRHFDLLSFIILTTIHLFFLVAIFTAGLYRELPILIFLSLASLVAHLLIHFLPFLINRKTIYWFRAIKEEVEEKEEKLEEIIDATLK